MKEVAGNERSPLNGAESVKIDFRIKKKQIFILLPNYPPNFKSHFSKIKKL